MPRTDVQELSFRTQTPHQRPRQAKRPSKRFTLLFAGALLVAAGIAVFALVNLLSMPEITNVIEGESRQDAQSVAAPTESIVSFVAVGDNLPEISIGNYGDACAGEIGDGLYDYRPIFQPLKPYIQAADLAYVCFEVHAGGDGIGPRGWPSFNTTEAMVDAIEDTGFNLISSATNHSFDWGYDALTHSASLWEEKDVLFTGTARSQESADSISTIEKNGIVFSLLSYTYGINGYEESQIPAYAVNYMHEDKIRSDIARARELSDVVLVAMHWGTEYYAEADETQQYYAQVIADAGADVILGSHTHVIGPVAWVEGATGNKTLVAYSLGNFLSNHEIPYQLNELGGMLSCDFVKDATGVRIENIQWTPLINHSEEAFFALYTLQDYTEELAAQSRVFKTLADPFDWFRTNTTQIVGTIPEFNL